ncbi:hypothetical protein [Streptomyces phaeochromogenes]|uniref:hypothetical protein n=1 Tax=Streptomyces phaeochromogenes TaxID=1923 RepID=UPI0036BCA49E
MALQPWEATLIAASVTSVVSTAAVVVTHLLTRKRDRNHRVWDRQMDVYAEAMRLRRSLAATRRDVLSDKTFPTGALDPDYQAKEFWLSQAQLEMFGSPEVRAVNDMSFATLKHWTTALLEWRDLTALARIDPKMQKQADAKWGELESLAETAKLADQRLVEAITAEAKFKKPFKKKSRIPQLKLKRSSGTK